MLCPHNASSDDTQRLNIRMQACVYIFEYRNIYFTQLRICISELMMDNVNEQVYISM